VAKFFSYLSSPEVQAWWHQETGYLPITQAAYDLTKSQGFYDKNPGADVAIKQMTAKPPTEASRGIRFGNMVQIRDVIDEELEGPVRRAEERAGGARRGGEAGERAAAVVRAGEQLGSSLARRARRRGAGLLTRARLPESRRSLTRLARSERAGRPGPGVLPSTPGDRTGQQ
jgi:hypothetical protein